jgi:hypothetical protein
MNPDRTFAASVVGNLPKLQPEIRERVDVVLAKKEAAQ